MRVVRWARAMDVKRDLVPRIEGYRVIPISDSSDPAPAREWQLRRFNELWSGYCANIPYYRELVSRGVPREFRTWSEFADSVPVMTKALIRERRRDLEDPSRPAQYERVTGGSTGEPTRMAEWNSARQWTMIDKWLGRSWWGVTPADPVFMVWGHSHLLNQSLRGTVGRISRKLRDAMLGTYRLSAYDLGPKSIERGVKDILAVRPKLIIGYSSALEYIARACADRRDQLRGLGLKGVLATGEQFMTDDGPRLISDVFGAPVIMEYGSVETDVIAYGHPGLQKEHGLPPAQGYRVFWQSYFLESAAPSGTPGACLVTSLFPRRTPLVRYDIGDQIQTFPGHDPRGVLSFQHVVGRVNDMVRLPDGTEVHTMAIKHCVEHQPGIARFQMVRRKDAFTLKLELTQAATSEGNAGRDAMSKAVLAKLSLVNPQLGATRIVTDEEFELTPAGKLLLYFDHDRHAVGAAPQNSIQP